MKVLRGTIFGGIAFFILGWLIYGILLDWMAANSNSCSARPEGIMIWWALIASNLLVALFLTLFLKRSGAKSVLDGIKNGALFVLLLGLGIDLSFYSMTTMFVDFFALVVDVVSYILILMLVGMVIVLTWGKKKTA